MHIFLIGSYSQVQIPSHIIFIRFLNNHLKFILVTKCYFPDVWEESKKVKKKKKDVSPKEINQHSTRAARE